MTRIIAFALLVLIGLSGPVRAQDDSSDSGGMLVRLLESTLSSENRNIRVVGLVGALSSRATIEMIEVSDADGIWLRLSGAVLDWNRLALVRGRFSVNELTAQSIEVLRKPLPSTDPDLPAPEAQPFSMPELPVSIEIGKLSLASIDLGEELVGLAATLSVSGKLTLADGALDTDLAIDRLDRAGDRIALRAGFANQTRQIDLDLRVEEAAGGLIGQVMKLPGRPPVVLTAQGAGPVDNFAADLKLATDGTERVQGRVELTGDGEGDAQAIVFSARVNGDLRPLLAEEYRAFFGAKSSFDLTGRREADGRFDVDHIALAADAVKISGDLALSAAQQADRVNLDIVLTPVDGAEVTLPFGGGDTRLRGVSAVARFDAAQGENWTLTAELNGLLRPEFTLGKAAITANGQYRPGTDEPLAGNLVARIRKLDFADPALSAAAGQAATVVGGFALSAGDRLALTGLDITGGDYRAMGDLTISGLNSGFEIDGSVNVEARDLSRLAGLAGRPLAGALTARLTGRGAPLGGGFDIVLDGVGQDLRFGQDTVDPLLTGQTVVRLDAARGQDGLVLRELKLDGEALDARIVGTARTGASDLTIEASLDDLGRILPDLPGPVSVSGEAAQRKQTWNTSLDISAPGGARAALAATVPVDLGPDLAFDVTVSEPAGGPLGQILKIQGGPALALTAKGGGPITDFAADIALATDGTDRLTGRVTVRDDAQAKAFHVAVTGDVTPFLQDQFRSFFGPDTVADLTGTRYTDGRIDLSALTVTTNAMQIKGSAALNAESQPVRADLSAAIAPTGAGREVRLPIPGEPVTIRQAQITARLDGEAGDSWTVSVTADGLSHPQAYVSRLTMRGNGAYRPGDALSASGSLRAGVQGLTLSDPALNAAVGSTLGFDGQFDLPGDDTLTLSGLTVRGGDLEVLADAAVSDLSGEQAIKVKVDATHGDLARLSGLAQRPLSGSVTVNLDGSGAVQARQLDAILSGVVRGLGTGIAQADAILGGETQFRLDAAGQADGVSIRSFLLTAPGLAARASGMLSQTETDLTARVTLKEMSVLLPQLQGEMVAEAGLTRNGGPWKARLQVDAPNDSYLTASGSTTPNGASELKFEGRMNKLERFMTQFPGSLEAKGTARREDGIWQVEATAAGPADISAVIAGSFDEFQGTADATAKGRVQLAAANSFVAPLSVIGNAAFDLALRGKPKLNAVSGTVTVSGTSVAVPQIQNALQGVGGTVTLANGRADVNMRGALRTGGTFTVGGPVALTPPFDGNIAIALQSLILTDGLVYRAPVDGRLTFAGPLAGNAALSGRIDIGETEINIGAISGSSSAAPIPDLIHVGEPGAVYVTRERAGLIDTGNGSGGGANIGLDVLISAPRKIFVRGRGLDAELGGQILVRGSTARVAPSGQIELIRGFMGLFGRRLELSKGRISMQGSLHPFLEFAATSSTDSGSATLELSGELDNLKVSIFSDPERPEEEALALLLFGNEFSSLSPFKIAQIAASLITLRGGGSDIVGTEGRKATGADTVSIAGDSGGQPSLGVGGYLADNVYTDVSVNTDGDTELNINLDVTDSVTIKGMVDNSGQSGIGLFYDREF